MSKIKLGKVTMTPKGEYNSSTMYERLDSVSFNGSSWLVLKPCTGIEPKEGDYYTLLAGKGDTGKTGEAGVSVTHKWNGTKLEVTSASGTSSADLKGKTGDKGKDGMDVTHKWNGTTLEVTSASGTSSADLKGKTGDKGKDGIDITHEWDGTALTVTSASGTSSADLKGERGASAYELWLEQGNEGTEADFIASLSYQSDLAENNPTSAAYVKNRTHWVDDEEDIANAFYSNEFDYHRSNRLGISGKDMTLLNLIDGQRYFVYWDDKVYYKNHRYECFAKTAELDGEIYTYVGNLYLFDKSLSDTGEPFCLARSNLTLSSGYVCCEYGMGTVTLYCAITTVAPTYHQISKEYLPDVIKETRVTERDIFPETLINFSETTIDGGGNAIMPRIALNPNAEYTVYWNGNKYTLRPTVNVDVAVLGGYEYPFIYTCYSPSSPYFKEGVTMGVLVTTKGVESATIRICEFVNELQPKYMPKGYGGFAEDVILLPETDLWFTDDYQAWGANNVAELMREGEEYTVTINGVEYTGVAMAHNLMGFDCTGFGNQVVVGGENTGEPFFAVTGVMNGNSLFAIFDLTGATAVRASLVKHGEIIPFDPRLITASEVVLTSPSGKQFRLTVDDSGNLTATDVAE